MRPGQTTSLRVVLDMNKAKGADLPLHTGINETGSSKINKKPMGRRASKCWLVFAPISDSVRVRVTTNSDVSSQWRVVLQRASLHIVQAMRISNRILGSSRYNQSSATHIITSQWLSGSKTHKLLNGRARNKVQVVSPQWLTDSLEKGKRQSEWRYTKAESGTQRSVLGFTAQRFT